MRLLTTLLAVTGLTVSFTALASDVIELTAKTFTETVDPEKLILVEFFAPWCGHCKALAPEYETAATQLKEMSIKLAKVDCTSETDLCQEHGVQGYPTLKVFENGTSKDYSGARKADGIVSFMKKRSMPAVSPVTAENHTEFTKADRVVLVAYLDSKDTANHEVFATFANQHRDDYVFGSVDDHSNIADVSSLKAPSLVLWKAFDEGRNDYTGAVPFTVESLREFAQKHSVPLFDEISPSNFATYADSGLPLAYTFIAADDAEREALIKSLEPIAKTHQGSINFVWIDAAKFADHAKSLNLAEPTWPAFAIQNVALNEKFPLDQTKKVDHATVSAFVADFVAGKISASIKSEPIPKTQEESVYVLVADEFDKVVFEDKEKDVFVEFYAPWCGHCRALKPTWDRLGDGFLESKDKITIAKFDATENDVPPSAGFRVTGFPTLKFKPAGSKEFIDYQGDRTYESLVEFVEENSANKVKANDAPAVATEAGHEEAEAEEHGSHDEL